MRNPLEANEFARKIICTPKDFAMVSWRYPRREVICETYCDDNWAYVMRRFGKGILAVNTGDWSVWRHATFKVPNSEEVLYGMRKIRPRGRLPDQALRCGSKMVVQVPFEEPRDE